MPESVFHFPVVTSISAGLLGLLYAVLTILVIAQRGKNKVMIGDGSGGVAPSLLVAVRGHANFAEYVPLLLLIIAALECFKGPVLEVKLLAYGLVLARVLHPIGMYSTAPNPFRAGGASLTMLILIVGSAELLRRASGF